MTATYADFVASKRPSQTATGHEVSPDDISPRLYPFQQTIVRWAVAQGRAAIFAETGMGKGLMGLEWARHVPGRVLLLCPLAVGPQMIREAEALGIRAARAGDQAEADALWPVVNVVVTNYERLERFDPSMFSGVVMDESSIVKSFDGATTKALIQWCRDVPYRLACTATPAPNDHVELGNHAELLGVMPMKDMLSRWFVNDTSRTGVYRLKGHARADFWKWCASWAVACRRPSDVGDFRDMDEAFELPALKWETTSVPDPDAAGRAGTLFVAQAPSATGLWKDKRETAEARAAACAEVVAREPDESWIVWCETDHESGLLAQAIPGSVEVKGSMPADVKERRLDAFSMGEARVLITKPSVAGFGLNWQHCARVLFAGLTFSHERTYQAVRRCWRYGQTRPVVVHVVTAESEAGVADALARKAELHEVMSEEMVAATRESWAQKDAGSARATGEEQTGAGWRLVNGDSCEVLGTVPDASVHLSVFSPPFADVFVYSDDPRDIGNCKTTDEYLAHMRWLAPELYRVTVPGRLACVHVSDLPRHKFKEGVVGLYDLPGDIVRAFQDAGWTYHSRITIWRDPVVEMTRTKAIGLLHKSFAGRREACRTGIADTVLVFRRYEPGMADHQVTGMADPAGYIGTEPPQPTGDPTTDSIAVWQKYASPVWFDVDQTRVLDYRSARTDDDERHLCPLQLDVIERCVWMWSNPGETVLDPFNGIGSTGYVAVKSGRQYLGVELKPSYFQTAVRNLQRAEREALQGGLFEVQA